MLKILMVDYEKYERESIAKIILNNFKDKLVVLQAKNGREAIEISEQNRPDIVIMDINMPGINGIDAMEEIKKCNKNTYFIVLTAYDYFDFAMDALKLKVKSYLLKPFDQDELINEINKAMISVEEEKQNRRMEIENTEKINNLMRVFENEVCQSIIENDFEFLNNDDYMKYLKIKFTNTFCILVEVDKSEHLDMKRVDIYISDFLNLKYKAIYTSKENIVTFFVEDNKKTEGSNEIEESINIGEKIRDRIKKHFKISCKIGIGSNYNNIDNVNKSYEEAKYALCYGENEINHISYLKQKNDSKQFLFNKVIDYLNLNMSETLELEKVAAKFNLSSFYFSRIFKEYVGCTFSDYINKIRINKAKELLQSSELSVKEIGFKVGYSDPNYFSKVFKKYEGYPPTAIKSK